MMSGFTVMHGQNLDQRCSDSAQGQIAGLLRASASGWNDCVKVGVVELVLINDKVGARAAVIFNARPERETSMSQQHPAAHCVTRCVPRR